jgi:hypothetical protein
VLSLCFGNAVGQSGAAAAQHSTSTWRFAISGDSRNCGDVVMPAIAHKVAADGAVFYWHLGDYRAIYDFDQDFRQAHPNTNIINYESAAWPDFIQQQLVPFEGLPVYLSLGNHETIPPKTRSEAIQQFADWFDAPELKAQRLRDDPNDHLLKAYYHWIKDGVDFVTLDNSSDEQFDKPQLDWIKKVIDADAANAAIRTLVVGMHEALPDSLSTGHSMNESAQGTVSGRIVYKWLVDFRAKAHKNVYLLASHSHFYLEDVFNTACRRQHSEEILPGWIIGTAGAVRYRLPDGIPQSPKAQGDTYGYLVGTVSSDGSITFDFKKIDTMDVPAGIKAQYSDTFVKSCFDGNKSQYKPDGPTCQ